MFKYDTQGNIIKEKIIEDFSDFKFSLNNVFDQIYLINSKKENKKFNRIDFTLKTLNIKYKLIEAIDEHKLSHFLALKDAKKNKYLRILILEDNIIFRKNFNNLFHIHYNLLNKKHKDWKMLFLGCSFSKKHTEFNSGKKFIKAKNSFGSFAVGIDCSLLDLIFKFENDNRSIDLLYQQEIEDKYKSFVFNPMLITIKLNNLNTPVSINNQNEYLKKNNLLKKDFYFNFNPNSKFIMNIPIYWINLNRSVQRRKNIIKKIKKMNIYQNKRIDAINGRNLSYYNFNIPIKYFLHTSNNELACTFSHLKAIFTAYYNKEKYVIVCEDDICFELLNYSKYSFNSLIKKAPKDWEIIQLSTSNKNQLEKLLKLEEDFVKWERSNWGSYSYLLNRKGMSKVVKKFSKNKVLYLPNDIVTKVVADLIIYELCNSYTLTKGITTYNDIKSTLHNNHLYMHQLGKNKLLKYYKLKKICSNKI